MSLGWREAVVAYIRAEALAVDKYCHQPPLYALACRVGEGADYDDDIVFAATWIHDLGVFTGHRPQNLNQLARWNHVPSTIRRGRQLFSGWDFLSASWMRLPT